MFPDSETAPVPRQAALTGVRDRYGNALNLTRDSNSNLTRISSPSGRWMEFAYDGSNRITQAKDNAGRAVGYQYDAAGRLWKVTDANNGVTEYGYDAAGRLAGKTVTGQPAISYTYDAASRLTGITQGASAISFGYDDADRRTSLTLPNGVVTGYGYDAASQLTSLTYKRGGVTLGDLSYGYDAAGRQTKAGGSFARSLPQPLSSSTHDDANIAQERAGGAAAAELLNGGIDEVFSRAEGAGTRNLLADALGSTLALADSSGAVQTGYAYDPFGSTASAGDPTGSASQYTGRENDGTGLYYYRARYYSPSLQRFVSEDPIGFRAGDINLFAYVGNSPSNFTDPSGEQCLACTQPREAPGYRGWDRGNPPVDDGPYQPLRITHYLPVLHLPDDVVHGQ